MQQLNHARNYCSLPKFLSRKVALLLPVAAIMLAGCTATTESARKYPHGNNHLAQNKADPLGAYLASRDFVKATAVSERNMATTALNQLGIKYRFGGGAPSTGFDCSGLVIYAAQHSLGLKLPRSSAAIANVGKSISRSELKEGDLVFFNTRGHKFSHVGIYLGDQKFVHAPSSGSVVRIESMDIAYWSKRYNGARRLDTGNSTLTARAN